MTSRNHRVFIGFVLTMALGSVGAFLACTDSYRGSTGAGGSTGPGGHGAGGDGTGGTGGVAFNDGSICETTCSNDLQKVINCHGTVLETCAPDKACANAQCVVGPPCDAAEQSKSSLGCDFWAVDTAQQAIAAGACFAVYIANTWPKPVNITVERNGVSLPVAMFAATPSGQGAAITYTPYDDATGLAEDQVAILFLGRDPNGSGIQCPIDPAITAETGVTGTGIGDAFHIRTDYPVVAYQIQPFGGGQTNFTSATLLLPTSAWDTNYISINAYKRSQQVAEGQPALEIVAKDDGTTVTILPKVNIVAGPGVPAAMANTPTTYNLNAGEFLQIVQPEELTGSPIQSNKPVGFFGASTCMNVPDNVNLCDSGQQQIAPVKALGSEYVAVRYRGRAGGMDEAPPWRLVGAVDGTQLIWTPEAPPGAPTSINLGEVKEFNAPGPFVVRSQGAANPFYLGAYMTGGAPFANEGDPDWVNVIPPKQYLDKYVFFTDPTYPETSLVVIRTKNFEGNFADVELDCGANGGVLGGWQDLGEYQYTRVDLVTGNFTSVDGCSNGGHKISSSSPFGVTVWGWGNIATYKSVSYAYPAGAGFQPINEVVVPPNPD
jgi:hypothetical protein